MKIIQFIKDEVIPLSGKKQVVLLIIIASVFQFVLFYAPSLANAAHPSDSGQINGQDSIIINDSIAKDAVMNQAAAKLTSPLTATSSVEIATTTPSTLATSTPTGLATSTPADQTATSSTPALKVIKTEQHVITAYNSQVAQTDDDPCTTANGFNVCKHNQEDTIAANFLKFGTKVKIPTLFGDRVFVVRDRMSTKHPSGVDIWMKSYSAAINFGVKVADIQVLE